MNIEEVLKQFKSIEADPDFVRKSRRLILISRRNERKGFLGIIFRTMELGASVALVGLAIFMILGGFSSSRVLSPLQISNLDPASIKAEAQAIDIQIKLANLGYKEGAPALTPTSESTMSIPKELDKKTMAAAEGGGGATSPTATSSAPEPLGIDEALDKLAE